MTHTQFFRPLNRQNRIALDLAIATLINASTEDFTAEIEQLPTEQKRELTLKLILAASLTEKIEIIRFLPLVEQRDLAQAIAQVWQEED